MICAAPHLSTVSHIPDVSTISKCQGVTETHHVSSEASQKEEKLHLL